MPKATLEIKSQARQHTDAAIRVLVEIMTDRAAPHKVRVMAATEIINRGLGRLAGPVVKFEPVEKEFYVYSVHDSVTGRLIYIGKGCDRRHMASAARFAGKSRIRASFDSESDALDFERRLIKAFRPRFNIVHALVHAAQNSAGTAW